MNRTIQFGTSLLTSVLGLFVMLGTAQAQTGFPNKPVRLILPFAVGGSTDAMARLLAQKLSEIWGQTVLVDSKPGGTSTIGTLDLVRSPADGHTLLFVNNDFVINPNLIPNMPYDTLKDIAAVGPLARSDYVLAINASVPANNLKELIALAKSKSGQLNAASTGTGGPQHLAHELFNTMADVKIVHIPYRGAAPAMTDLLGNQVQMTFSNPMSLNAAITAGKLKGIAISGDKRSPILPNVPTFAEAGLPGYRATNWFGIVMHARTPPELINRISADIIRVQRSTDFPAQLIKSGVEPFVMNASEFSAFVREEIERIGKLIKSANIKLEQH